MRYLLIPLLSLSLIALAGCGSKAAPENTGPWLLDSKESGISYVTIKNGSLGEVNTFSMLSGEVSEGGKAEFVVYLDSVDTANEIRDPRMRKILFETDNYPTATVTADLKMAEFNELPVGDSKSILLEMTLDMHGISEQFDADMNVTRIGPNKVRVDSAAPLLIDAEDFGFGVGLAKLQELAGLQSITPVVSATVGLTFER